MSADISSFDTILLNTRDNLSYLLHAGNLSLSALSELIGVTKAYISRWISGDTLPSFRAVCNTCRVFEIPIEQFCLTNMQQASQENFHEGNVIPRNDEESLALAMFQSLSDFDRETILRNMQSLSASAPCSEAEFVTSVIPKNNED